MQIKTVILFFLLSRFNVNVNSQSDLQKQNISGPVQKIVETEFDVMPSEDGTVISTLQQKWNEYYYNENGMLTGWVDFYYNGNISSYYKKNYDSTGNLISQIFYMPDNTITGSIWYTYNTKNLETEWIRKDGTDKIIYTWKNWYNKKGQRIKSCSYTKSEIPDFIYTYTYNKKNQRISEAWYDSTLTKTKIIQYEFDASGNQTVIATYDGSMNPINKWVKEYNQNNQTSKAVLYLPTEKIGSDYIYAYDSLKNVVSVMSYDVKGEIIKSTSYVYEYDDYGNWIKKTEMYFDVPVKTWGRQIIYY